MKKILYIFLFTLVTAMSLSACTEESVVPENANGGGGEIVKGKD